MNRWLLRICVFLLLGAIVNVAVAWAPIVIEGPKQGTLRMGKERLSPPVPWEIHRWDSSFVTLCISRFSKGTPHALHEVGPFKSSELIPRWGRIDVPTYPPLVGPPPNLWQILDVGYVIADQASGWPARSLWCAWGDPILVRNVRADDALKRDAWSILVAPARTGNVGKALPLRPIWPGFAINTVFYAAVLWLLFAAPFALRRWRRSKRGLCPSCAYDLRATLANTCPECGSQKK